MKISIIFAFILPFYSMKIKKTDSGDCDVSDVSISFGDDSPMMSYSARIGNEEFSITAIHKDYVEKVQHNFEMFNTDKDSGYMWFKDSNLDLRKSNFSNTFSYCRKLHDELLEKNKNKKLESFVSETYKIKLRKDLPKGIKLRIYKVDEDSEKKLKDVFK